jgi:hypothetical protein
MNDIIPEIDAEIMGDVRLVRIKGTNMAVGFNLFTLSEKNCVIINSVHFLTRVSVIAINSGIASFTISVGNDAFRGFTTKARSIISPTT